MTTTSVQVSGSVTVDAADSHGVDVNEYNGGGTLVQTLVTVPPGGTGSFGPIALQDNHYVQRKNHSGA